MCEPMSDFLNHPKTDAFYKLIGSSFILEWLFAFTLVVTARLPYLLGQHVFFDGDEAIIGIMGRDLLSFNGLPFYFYGQQYGFSFFETLSAAFFILFLGSGVASLKLGGMLLFSLGIQRFFKIFRWNQFSFSHYLLCSLVLVMFPPWLVWGTMLRGGYITAFVAFSFIVEHLIINSVWKRKEWQVVAFMSSLIAVSQVFFILPLLPLLVFRLTRLSKLNMFFVSAWAILTFAALRLPAYLNPDFWTPTGVGSFHPQNIFTFFIQDFWSYFSGFFSYEFAIEVPGLLGVGLRLFVLLLTGYAAILALQHSKSINFQLLLLILGTGLAILPIALFEQASGRYVLGFQSGMLALFVHVAVYSQQIEKHIRTAALALIVVVLLPVTMGLNTYVNSLLEPKLNDMQALNEMANALKSNEIENAIVLDWQLQWQLNYLMNDAMNFRSRWKEDRLARYSEKVNNCYLQDSCAIGVIGTHWSLSAVESASYWQEKAVLVNGRYFLIKNPEQELFCEAQIFVPAL